MFFMTAESIINYKRRYFCFASAILLLVFAEVAAQNIEDSLYASTEIKTVVPGKGYETGWLHNIVFGEHWRSLWTLPLDVEVIDLDRFAGGITPVKRGGGFQTKSLRFQGKDGYVWKFRSIDKDPAAVLPEYLQKSIVADVLQDQISSSNPFAAIIAAPILKAAGVLQSQPKMFILPDDEKLGEYQSEFANILGTMEVNPDEYEESGDLSFSDADKITGTFKLMNRLEKERSEKVNSKEFLKARLIDIFLGDWDRHVDQWRWARYKTDRGKLWHPIPRDRDQAFALFDGILPSITTYYVPQLNHFGHNYPSVEKITWSGRHLDRRYLVELTKAEWDSITNHIFISLTDEVIYNAVRVLPEKQFQSAGGELISKLLSRKKLLPEISNEFYELTQKVADIRGSSKDDFAEVSRNSDSETEVKIFKRDKNTGEKKEQPFFQKTFDNFITDEIRIYLDDGDDKAVISGHAAVGPVIRLVMGGGKDEVVDHSEIKGYALGFLPWKSSKKKIFVYDSGKKSVIKSGSGTVVDNSEFEKPGSDAEKYEPQQNDRGSDWLFYPYFQSDTDNGIIFGSTAVFHNYGFRAIPFQTRLKFFAAYATVPQSFNVRFSGEFNSIIKKALLNIDLSFTQLRLTKYFGYGNQTGYSSKLENNDFYGMEQELFEANPSLSFSFFKSNFVSIGFNYTYRQSRLSSPSLFNTFRYNDYGSGKFSMAGAVISFEVETRDNTDNPHRGIYLSLKGSSFPDILDNEETFSKLNYDLRSYFTFTLLSETTLALRTGGGKVWGKYPFFEAEFLGGPENLRGYNRERFSGDASIFFQSELRVHIGEVKLIVPGKYGALSFVETGRVFAENEKSDRWHSSYGAGLWFSFIDRAANISINFAASHETNIFILKFAMSF